MNISSLRFVSRQPAFPLLSPTTIAIGFAFLSGFLSLGYQYFWFKILSIVVGVDLYSSSVVISGFFVGLGLGSLAFTRKPFSQWKFGVLELLTTVTAVSVSIVLTSYEAATSFYLYLSESVGHGSLIVLTVMFAIPAFFMGGSLIVLLRHLQHIQPSGSGKIAGRVYAANLIGAAIGTISAGIFMVAAFGVKNSLIILLAVNLFLSLNGWLFTRKASYFDTSTSSTKAKPELALISLYSLSGFMLIAFELIWFQILNQLLLTSTLIYAVLLSLLLLGLGIGNQIGTMTKFKSKFAFAALFSGLAMLIPVIVLMFPELTLSPLITYNDMYHVYASLRESDTYRDLVNWVFDNQLQSALYRTFVTLQTSTLLILPSSICFGLIFPLISQVHSNNQIAMNTGTLLGFNTLFGVVATVVVGFLLIPHFGLVTSVQAVTIVGSIILGIVFISRTKGEPLSRIRYLIYPVVVLSIGFSLLIPSDLALRVLLNEQKFSRTNSEPVYFSEGKGHTISILEEQLGNHEFKRLFIRGESNTGDMLPALRYMRLQAYLPYLVHKSEPQNALVIGLGTGNTAGAFTQIDSLKQINVYELLPKMIEATKVFSETNYSLTENPKVSIHIGDGRLQLSQSKESYDIITLEPPPPSSAGVNNLYSVDFYKLANKRLADHGVLAQWLPPHTQSVEGTISIVAAVAQVFPYVTIWQTEMYEYLIIASNNSFDHVSYDTVNEKIKANPLLGDSMKEIGVDSTEYVLASYVSGNNELATLIKDAVPITDDNALLETDLIGGFNDYIERARVSLNSTKDLEHDFAIPSHAEDAYKRASKLQSLISGPTLNIDELSHFEGNAYADWFLTLFAPDDVPINE